MIYIPPLTRISATLKSGSVYYFFGDGFKSDEPHYYVVLNKTPFESITLVVVNATSKVSRWESYAKRRNLPPETIVKVTTQQCPFLHKESVFNCNLAESYTPQRLLELCDSGTFKHKGEVTIDVLNKLIEGVLASPLVKKELKKLI
jgi:hypothetical protein